MKWWPLVPLQSIIFLLWSAAAIPKTGFWEFGPTTQQKQHPRPWDKPKTIVPFTAYFNIAIGKLPTGALSNRSIWTIDILSCYYLYPDQLLVGSQNNNALSKASELECCIIKREGWTTNRANLSDIPSLPRSCSGKCAETTKPQHICQHRYSEVNYAKFSLAASIFCLCFHDLKLPQQVSFTFYFKEQEELINLPPGNLIPGSKVSLKCCWGKRQKICWTF